MVVANAVKCLGGHFPQCGISLYLLLMPRKLPVPMSFQDISQVMAKTSEKPIGAVTMHRGKCIKMACGLTVGLSFICHHCHAQCGFRWVTEVGHHLTTPTLTANQNCHLAWQMGKGEENAVMGMPAYTSFSWFCHHCCALCQLCSVSQWLPISRVTPPETHQRAMCSSCCSNFWKMPGGEGHWDDGLIAKIEKNVTTKW